MLSNPTGGRRWIVESQPTRPTTGNKAWDCTIHRLPPVGLRRIFRVLGSLGLNNPPAAAGGILVNITCVETLAGPLCATPSAIPISFSVADPKPELLLQAVYYIRRLALPVDPSAMTNAECNMGNGKSTSPDGTDRPHR